MGAMQEVREYLHRNAALRDALGFDGSAQLWVKPLGKGEHNENYLFGAADEACIEGCEDADFATDADTCFVLRVNRIPQPFHRNQIAYEFAALTVLERSGCTPKPLYADSSAHALGNGVLVESFCPGRELDFDHLRPNDLSCAAALMANVHAVPVNDACPLFRPEDPLKQLFDECVDRFSAYKGTAFEDIRFTRWIERFLSATQEKIDAAPAAEEARHIINTETLPSHFLLAKDCGEGTGATLGAFVDWERPIVGEVAQDLAFFVAPSTTFWDSEYLFPHNRIQAFLDEYWCIVDGRFKKGAFEARFDAYLAVSVLRSQTWFCKNAARYAQKSAAHTVQRTFDKWDIYTSDEFNEMLLRECF